jgi:hypothetical protein
MATRWTEMRALVNAAIDACEAVEKLGVTESDRELATQIGGSMVSIHDLMTTAWVYPENVRYQVVRARHDAGLDKAYVDDLSRALAHVGMLCAELVGAPDWSIAAGNPADGQSLAELISDLTAWYRTHLAQQVAKARA